MRTVKGKLEIITLRLILISWLSRLELNLSGTAELLDDSCCQCRIIIILPICNQLEILSQKLAAMKMAQTKVKCFLKRA